MNDELNADFGQRAVADTTAMDWAPSPSPTVWRKRLELAGGAESGRVTSVVRYDADAAFPSHPHPDGEEILVLDGVFSDEAGDWPAGSYLLNPEGFMHAPFSRKGCVLFVKLRQYGGAGRAHVALDTNKAEWQAGSVDGMEVLPLYQHPDGGERMALVRFAPGTTYPAHDHPGGEEIFVIDGALEDEHGRYPAGTWLRQPPDSAHTPRAPDGGLIYVKTGHLSAPS